ncbi:MAG: orotate phosphoribosyltransferase [Phycisphaerales bacterium]|nr:orotate phosphoribosyltransferase [Phycisphaerales bacterium]
MAITSEAVAREVTGLLEHAGALRTGHFLLSSGLHSDRYCQCSALFERPDWGGRAASLLRTILPADFRCDVVLSPALGGVLWGYDVARALGGEVRSMFAERGGSPGDRFALRRSFSIAPGQRVLLAEDVVTTGGSILELVPLVRGAGAAVAGFAAVVDRSGGAFSPPDAPFYALASLSFQTFRPEACPMCAAGSRAEKPGSRNLRV